MLFVFRLCAGLPLWVVHALGWCLGWLALVASARYRRAVIDHAQLAGYAGRTVWAAVGHAGRMAAEIPRLWLGRSVPVRFAGDAAIMAAAASGKGVVFLTPHLGCFEVTAQAYARIHAPQLGPITVLYRPARQRWLEDLQRVARDRPGLAAAPASLQGVRQLVRALRSGHAVGLLPDQVPPQGQGVWAPFFGREAYTMTLAARLVQQTGAAVVLAWGERLSWGRGFVVHCQPLAEVLSADALTAATQINAAMERLVRACPQQYLWGYQRYKQPRVLTAPEAASAP